jgi:hypothetical protein
MSDDEDALTVHELIRELAGHDPSRLVRLWCGDADCVVTGVRSYRGPDEMRLDIEYVNRKQVER